MIHHQGLEKDLLAEAVMNAMHTLNRCSTSVLEYTTPEEARRGKKPSVWHMRIFGCIAYALEPGARKNKLDAKDSKCLLLGYCEGTKVIRMMCMDSEKIIKSCDVVLVGGPFGVGHSEMPPSGRVTAPTLMVVEKSLKSMIDDGEEVVEDNHEVQERPCIMEVLPSSIKVESEQDVDERQYPFKERWPPREWSVNHMPAANR